MNRQSPPSRRSTPSPVAVGPTVFAALLCLLAAYMALDSLGFRLAARLAPLLFSSVTLVLAAVVLVAEVADLRALRRGHRTGPEPEDDGPDTEVRLGSADERLVRGEMVAFAWFGSAIAAFFLFGFLVGMPLFMLLVLRVYGREPWLVTLGVTAGVMVVVYFMFVRVLGVRVYPGLLGDLIPFL